MTNRTEYTVKELKMAYETRDKEVLLQKYKDLHIKALKHYAISEGFKASSHLDPSDQAELKLIECVLERPIELIGIRRLQFLKGGE